ncbi:hypothetical protein ABH946_006077, partial [Bacillus sp. RC145]
LNNKLIPYSVTLSSWGLAPNPPASTHTQKQGGNHRFKINRLKNLNNFEIIILK